MSDASVAVAGVTASAVVARLIVAVTSSPESGTLAADVVTSGATGVTSATASE